MFKVQDIKSNKTNQQVDIGTHIGKTIHENLFFLSNFLKLMSYRILT